MKRILVLVFMVLCARADDPTVSQLYYSGGNIQYICEAKVSGPQTQVKFSDASLTNIVVATNVGTVTTASAHNLWIGATVQVTGSGTSALNATYAVATIPSSTTYTIATTGVADATYTTGLIISTNSPLLNSQVWRVTVLHYTAGVLDGNYLGGGSVSFNFKARCTDKATF